MTMRTLIAPTHHCFDDAADFIALLAVGVLGQRTRPGDYSIVHAICEVRAVRFAHAWVEQLDSQPPVIWQAGIVEDGRRVYYALHALPYAAITVKRYTLLQAMQLANQSGDSGPWDPEIAALCEQGTSALVGAVDIEPIGGCGFVAPAGRRR